MAYNNMAQVPDPEGSAPFRVPDVLASEYSALREEILKHIEVQYQVVGVALVAAGTFLTLGAQSGIVPEVAMVYPILAVFLAAAWADNQVAIIHIGAFIRDSFEPWFGPSFRWEARTFAYYRRERVPLHMLGIRGLFLVPQLLTVFLAADRLLNAGSSLSVAAMILLGIDAVAILGALWLLKNPRKHLRVWQQSAILSAAGTQRADGAPRSREEHGGGAGTITEAIPVGNAHSPQT